MIHANTATKTLIDYTAARLGLPPPDQRREARGPRARTAPFPKAVTSIGLQQANASLWAEDRALRAEEARPKDELARPGRIEVHMTETGRGVASRPAAVPR